MDNLVKIKEFISYDPVSGEFTWKQNKGRAKAGDVVGWLSAEGYRKAKIFGVTYTLHRLGWMMVNGGIADNIDIDHINCNRADNRISNLRLATRGQNLRNEGLRKNNRTGVKGVNWHKKHGKYQVQVMLNRKKFHGGYFDSLSDAEIASTLLRDRLHGEFCRHK